LILWKSLFTDARGPHPDQAPKGAHLNHRNGPPGKKLPLEKTGV